jgi:hypothetical protein
VAKRQTPVAIGPVTGTIWMSENFLAEPRRRSWPGPVTRLEQLAEAAGIDGDEYRMLLAEAVQARLRERGDAWRNLESTLEERVRRDGF